MMNKIKSAKVHLAKFLFVLPVLAVVLLAFRNYNRTAAPMHYSAGIVIDIGSHQPLSSVHVTEKYSGKESITDDKGYYSFSFTENPDFKVHYTFERGGYATMFSDIENKKSNIVSHINNYVELIGMKESINKDDRWGCWSRLDLKYQKQNKPVGYSEAFEMYNKFLYMPYTSNGLEFFKSNKEVLNLVWQTEPENIAMVYLKNGTVEKYKISNEEEYNDLINKFGKLPYTPTKNWERIQLNHVKNTEISDTAIAGIPIADTTQLPQDYTNFLKRNPTVKAIAWKTDSVIIILKSGKTEAFVLNNENSVASAEKKHGKLPVAPPPPPFKSTPIKMQQSIQELQQTALFLQARIAAYQDSLTKNKTDKQLKLAYQFLQQKSDSIEAHLKKLQSELSHSTK
jgi:hypothetical protein